MKETLQISPREMKDTLIDMAYSLIDAGLVKKTKKFKGPGGGEPEAGEEGEKKEEGGETEGEEKPKENGEVKDEDTKNEDDLKKVKGIYYNTVNTRVYSPDSLCTYCVVTCVLVIQSNG
jgi:hypothetical protein